MSQVKAIACCYSTVSPEELMASVIPDYCIDKPIECRFWERGSTDTYVVTSAEARYSLRIYRHNTNSRTEVDFEVDALNHLHNNGFPVAYPIARKAGGYITEIAAPEGVRFVLVTAFAPGSTPEYDSPHEFRLTGQSLAQLHSVSDGFRSEHRRKPIDFNLFAEDCFEIISSHVSHRAEDLAFLTECVEFARLAIDRVGHDAMDYGFCHGDVHGGNAHLHNDELRHFDFEECALGYRVFDLATFKWSFPHNSEWPERWAAFREGYESVRKINQADLDLIDVFVLLRHIWLIAFHMRNAKDFGGELLSDEYISHQFKRLKNIRFEGIGAALRKERDCFVIENMITGGAAAASGQLNVSDRILGIAESENGKWVSTADCSLNDVIDLIRGPSGSMVRLQIVPADSPHDTTPTIVTLTRQPLPL